ncbi:hypothetical protein ABZX99_02960 [Streptomyces antibioticus]|uniref:hypothetical protein n=1 Tax=Streptomyces antibioticus TaxID=1890 RepID=UPI0019619C59|nr:hypothetical protein [Streptomyces sp. S9]
MNRKLLARLASLEQAAPKGAGAVECRFHGVHCRLGANWPLDRAVVEPESAQLDELLDLAAQGRRKAGLPVDPHPRDLWAINMHERVPEAEIAQRKREAAELLAEMQARNEALETQLRAERP